MRVVNCVHCGTPNLIDDNASGTPRCIKCGERVLAEDTLIGSIIELLFVILMLFVPEKVLKFLLIGIIAAMVFFVVWVLV